MRSLAVRIFITFAVAFVAFGLVVSFGIGRMHALGRDLRLLSEGYLPLTRIAAQIEVKDWATARALEVNALDPAAQRAFLPIARAHFPAVVKEKLAEGRAVVARARLVATGADARFFTDVGSRFDALDAKWTAYDAAVRALFEALERPPEAGALPLVDRVDSVRRLEKGLSLDVKLLQAALDGQVADRVHAAERAERRSTALVVIYALLAFAVGVAAILIGQRLLAPIRILTDGVKAVAAGDLSRKVEVRSGDELGLLAREFNAMAASLDRQRSELLRVERLAAVGRISAQITHEIRNPLNAIGLNAELLVDEIERLYAARAQLQPEEMGPRAGAQHGAPAEPSETRGAPGVPSPSSELLSLVQAIVGEVDRLNAVTEEYLRFARLPKPVFAREDVNEILSGLVEFITPELKQSGVAVALDLAPDLPLVRGDEGQLRAAFLNLIRNSREAMPRGGRISIRTCSVDEGVEAEVRDTGAGIPAEALQRIFDPFYSTKEKGTGLGLAFTQQVVQEHGGCVRCESAPGAGTVFTVRLPRAPEERTGAGTAMGEAASA
jgi:two-component system, NtrC family, sensor kinase